MYIVEQIWPGLTVKIIISFSSRLSYCSTFEDKRDYLCETRVKRADRKLGVSRGWPNGRFDLEFIDLAPLHFWGRNSYIPAWFSCPDLTQRDIAISFRIGLALTYPPTYGRIRTKRSWRISPSDDKTCFKRVVKLCFLRVRQRHIETTRIKQYAFYNIIGRDKTHVDFDTIFEIIIVEKSWFFVSIKFIL